MRLRDPFLSRKQRLLWAVLGVLVGLGAALLPTFDQAVHTGWLAARPPRPCPVPILVVGIGDEYGWPPPRSLYSEVCRRLRRAGASTIALDLLFDNPGPSAEGDARLRGTLAAQDVVVPYFLNASGSATPLLAPAAHSGFGAVLQPQGVALRLRTISGVQHCWAVEALAHYFQTPPGQVLAANTRLWSAPGPSGEWLVGWPDFSFTYYQVKLSDLLDMSQSELTELVKEPFLAVVGVKAATVDLPFHGEVPALDAQVATLTSLATNGFLRPLGPVENLLFLAAVGWAAGVLASLRLPWMLLTHTLLVGALLQVAQWACANGVLLPATQPVAGVAGVALLAVVLRVDSGQARFERAAAALRERAR